MAVTSNGETLWLDGNCRLRKVGSDGSVVTVAGTTCGYLDGPGSVARFNHPKGLTATSSGERRCCGSPRPMRLAGRAWGLLIHH